jgi:hypothetical protein
MTTSSRMRRVGAFGAIAFVILNIVAFAIPGSPPDYDDSPAAIASWLTDNHKELLVAAVRYGVALFVVIAAIAQLADVLRTAGHPDAGLAVLIGGVLVLALLAAGVATLAAMSQMAMSGTDPKTLRAFYQATEFVFSVPVAWAGLGLVVPVLRVALQGTLWRRYALLNAAIAILLVLGGIAVDGNGVFQVGTGVFAGLAAAALAVYFVEVAVLLWRTAPALEPAAPEVAARAV